MFIIWHGLGWLAVILIGCFGVLFQYALPGKSDDFTMALSFICAAVPCWFIGVYLRDNYTTTVIDKKTGQKVRMRQPYHALFFIPMHYWAPISIALGIALLIYGKPEGYNNFHSRGNSALLISNTVALVTPSETGFVDQNPDFSSQITSFTNIYSDQLKQTAENGNMFAQEALAEAYEKGNGCEHDYQEALKWHRKAAEQGLTEAQLNLGMGIMVLGNPTEGIEWIQKAAEQGFAAAQTQLGAYYYRGVGVKKNDIEGAEWFDKAAEQGFAEAEANLGESYFQGDGVAVNYIEAYKWISLASAQGFTLIERPLSNLERRMTPEQVSQAQQLAREFKPRKAIKIGSSISEKDIIDSNPAAIGTGFFITDDGYLISNYHVVKDATKVRLVTSAGTIDAKVIQVDAANDLALLKAEGKFFPLPIAASRSAHLGGTVATIGFPDPLLQGFSPKLAKGEIASLSGASDDPRYFQVSLPVQPGNSGGALVDERGNVIGIVSAKLDARAALDASGALPENVNYAVKSSLLLSFLESMPDVDAKLKTPNTSDEKFEDVVKSAQAAAVLVLVY